MNSKYILIEAEYNASALTSDIEPKFGVRFYVFEFDFKLCGNVRCSTCSVFRILMFDPTL